MREPDYNDIVYRLRNPTYWFFQIVGPKSGATVQGESDAPREAADEIERLRAELAAANKRSLENYERWARDGEEAEARECALRCELAAEREAKQSAVDAAETYRDERDACIKEVAEAGKRQGQAEAERDALRALLKEVLDNPDEIWGELAARIDAALKEEK